MRIIYSVSRFAGYIATGVLGLMMLLTVTDVFLRYFFNAPITGTTEITEFMMVIVVFPALAWCALSGGHVKVDLVVSFLPRKLQAIIDSITLLATLCIFGILTWHSGLEAMQVNTTTSLLGLPQYPFYWILTLGLALFCLSIAVLVIERIIQIMGVKR